jgi:hypothetical protein
MLWPCCPHDSINHLRYSLSPLEWSKAFLPCRSCSLVSSFPWMLAYMPPLCHSVDQNVLPVHISHPRHPCGGYITTTPLISAEGVDTDLMPLAMLQHVLLIFKSCSDWLHDTPDVLSDILRLLPPGTAAFLHAVLRFDTPAFVLVACPGCCALCSCYPYSPDGPSAADDAVLAGGHVRASGLVQHSTLSLIIALRLPPSPSNVPLGGLSSELPRDKLRSRIGVLSRGLL